MSEDGEHLLSLPRAPGFGTIVSIAAAVAAAGGLLDVVWHFAAERPRLDEGRFWCLPLATTTVLAFLFYGLAYFGLRLMWRRLHAGRWAAALALSQLVVTFLVSSSGARADLRLISAYVALGFVVAAAVYFAAESIARRDRDSPLGSNVSDLFYALPFLLALALGFLLLRIRDSADRPATWLLILVFFPAVLLTLWGLRRSSPKVKRISTTGLWLLIVLWPLASGLVADTWPGPASGTPRSHRVPRILLLTIDTLRADHLGCYGAPNSPTPAIDALAGDGILFTRPLSPAPWTLPAFASMMTGVSPSLHQVDLDAPKLPKPFLTLAEHLQKAGYATAAVGKNVHLNRRSRLSKGFDQYQIYPRAGIRAALGTRILQALVPGALSFDVSTTELTSLAAEWLEAHGRESFFFWLHYFDPHVPYAPPAEYVGPGEPPPALSSEFSEVTEVRGGYMAPNPEEKEWIHGLYRGEVRHVDDNVGAVLGELKRLGIYEDTLIILTSDHGEEFWEHGAFEHGHSLYDELLRVPLIVKLPARMEPRERQVATPVSTESLMATVLELTGVPFAGEYSLAASLRPLWDSQAAPEGHGPVVSSSLHYYEDKIAVSFEHYKFICRARDGGGEELYDLAEDPTELRSIAGARPDLVERARKILEEHRSRSHQWADLLGVGEEGASGEIDPQALEELKSLGYVQ